MAIDPDVQVLLDEMTLQIDALATRVETLEAGGGGSPTGNYDVNGTFVGEITPVPAPVP